MAVLSPHYQSLFPLPYYKEEGECEYDVGNVAAELINHPSNHAPPTGNSIPLRYACILAAITCGSSCATGERCVGVVLSCAVLYVHYSFAASV
jgi:hypothetical protein